MPAKFTVSPDSSLAASATSVTSQTTTTSATSREPSRIRNVYVSSLPLGYTDSQLFELLSPFGAVASCRMFNDNKGTVATGHSYGFVLFERSADAAAACAALDGVTLSGRKLRVQLARNGLAKKTGIQPPPTTPPAKPTSCSTRDSHHLNSTPPASPVAQSSEWAAAVSAPPYALPTSVIPTTHWIPVNAVPQFTLVPGGHMGLPPYFRAPDCAAMAVFPPPPVCAPPAQAAQPATVVFGFSPIAWPQA